MTMAEEVFEPLTLAEITAATAKEPTERVDVAWRDRIATLPVGGGFKIGRSEGETSRSLKTRINRAAMATFRELTWYPQSGNLADGKPATYVVKVKAIDLKKQAEAAQKAQNGTVQAPEPSEPEKNGESPADENAPTARVGRR